MISSKIVDYQCGLESRHTKLVCTDVFPVELQVTNTIPNIGVPSQGHCPQIKDLDVSVVVASSNAALRVVVGIAKGNRPAISWRLPIHRLQRNYRVFLPDVPNAYRAITAACYQLGRAIADTEASAAIDGVHDEVVALDAPHGLLQVLQIPDGDVAHVIACGEMPLLDGRSAEGSALEASGLLHFCQLLTLPLVQIAHTDHTCGPWHLP
mmetsp:Transcript_100228/g.180866  ORF Transcript_100228/g.180866 Transcript_100228/m.180866 type:complete len:209 (+) Transcript_100228:388-1014(+)